MKKLSFKYGISLLLLIAAISSCGYPYNTRQARDARREAKLKKQTAITITPDTTKSGKPNKVSLTVDTSKTKPTIKGKIGLNTKLSTADSLAQANRLDSISKIAIVPDSSKPKLRQISFSKDSIDLPVTYNAVDSMEYNVAEQTIYLYGAAYLKYKEMEIKAAKISVNFKTKLATAECTEDSLGNRIGEPDFKDGEQAFVCRRMTYNFDTKKGKVFEATTSQGDGYLQSTATKFMKGAGAKGDDILYSGNCLYTTCSNPEAHFGLRASKAKIVPNKLIVVGPTYLEIGGVPTPLALPFGFFPITQGRRSGLIIPKDFQGGSTAQGFGIKNVGYYFGINDKVDLALTGDIYLRGSWGLHALMRYKERYHYNGSVQVDYSNIRFGDKETSEYTLRRDFKIRWTHALESAAIPGQSFSANVNLGTGTYSTNNNNDANSVLDNILNSQINYSKTFLGTPFALAVSAGHSQNVRTHDFTLSFPVVNFTMQRIYPFKRKKQVGKERWYEQIGLSYATSFTNRLNTKDTTLFSAQGLQNISKDLSYGIQHSPNIGLSLKLFKYISVNPTINYSERWYFYRDKRTFDPTPVIDTIILYDADSVVTGMRYDTTFGTVSSNRINGFHAIRDFSAGVNITTSLYGTLKPRILGIKAIRHTVRPSVGFNWRPDFSNPRWGYYDVVQTDSRRLDEYTLYDPYQGYIYGSAGQGGQAAINFGLANTLEMKVRSKSDTTGLGKKIKLLETFNISSSYNLLADSFKLSAFSVTGNTKLFKLISANFGGALDPYYTGNDGRRRNVFLWNTNKQLARLTAANISLGATFTGDDLAKLFSKDGDKKTIKSFDQLKPTDALSPYMLIQSTTIQYTLRVTKNFVNGVENTELTQSIDTRGALQLSKNWSVRYTLNYNIKEKKFVYPTFEFARQLHCWEMGMNWQPERRTWGFFLRVKSPTLNFINIPARRTQFDGL